MSYSLELCMLDGFTYHEECSSQEVALTTANALARMHDGALVRIPADINLPNSLVYADQEGEYITGFANIIGDDE